MERTKKCRACINIHLYCENCKDGSLYTKINLLGDLATGSRRTERKTMKDKIIKKKVSDFELSMKKLLNEVSTLQCKYKLTCKLLQRIKEYYPQVFVNV